MFNRGNIIQLLVLLLLIFQNKANQAQIKSPTSPYTATQASNPLGSTAPQVQQQTNNQAFQNMGYTPPSVPPSDPAAAHQYIQNQYKNQSKQIQQQQELMKLLDESKADRGTRKVKPINYNSPEFAQQTQAFTNALQKIKNMLTGKTPMSLKEAYYAIESAYGNPYLSKKEYNAQIKQSADFIKQWMAENNLNPKDNEHLHFAIQHFMSDTLTITLKTPDAAIPEQTITHLPFSYDYDDYKGETDHRNYFLTKSIATGTGQCNSLPATYLVLCEELGAKAYLSFAPQHALIKYPENSGDIKNYETTSNYYITDKWYMEHLFISPEAIRSRIYLDTLNKRKIIANCALDLAFGYLKKFGVADGKFIDQCIVTAIKEYPKQNNIEAFLLKSSAIAHLLEDRMQANNIKTIAEAATHTQTKELYNELKQNEEFIRQLGYQRMPAQLYEQMMEEQEFKNKLQKEKQINTKEKRNLFVKK